MFTGVGQIIVGCVGLIGNVLAVPVLLDKNSDLCNIFGRILSCLAIVDNVFITCSILEAIRKVYVTLSNNILYI